MHARVSILAAGVVVLALGFWFLVAGRGGAADDKGDVRGLIQKLADAIQKGDADQARTLAADISKEQELEPVMYLMKKRDVKGKAKGYFGVGEKPGSIEPDGIEAKIQNLSRAPKPQKQIDKESGALAEMGYRIAAIAEIARLKPNDKANNPKKKKDWAEYTEGMRKGADELAEAAKEKKPAGVRAAANKIYSSCNNCHGAFRDD